MKKREAICIKPYRYDGQNFKIKLLEIVTIDPEEKNPKTKLIWVRNKQGKIWCFVKYKKDLQKFRSPPQISYFKEYFKEIK